VNPMIAVALIGPATVIAVATCAIRPWTPGWIQTAATAALGGIAAALLLDGHIAATALPLIALGPAAAVIDIHEGRLPDVLTGPMLVATVALAIVSGPVGWHGIALATIATLGLLGIKAVAPEVIGWGDVKLAPTVAIVLGQHAATLPGVVCIIGLIALTAAAMAVQTRAASVPYGPALLLGTLVTVT